LLGAFFHRPNTTGANSQFLKNLYPPVVGERKHPTRRKKPMAQFQPMNNSGLWQGRRIKKNKYKHTDDID
jgi:hypothetical protein